jgi:membrane protein DedA with SNARE-associated domain
MLEIWIIIAVSRNIAAMMRQKGRSAAGYVTIFVFLWIIGEVGGLILGVMMAEQNADNEWMIWVFAIVGAAGGGTLGYVIAASMPAAEVEYDDDNRERMARLERFDDDEDRPRRRRPRDEDEDKAEDDAPRRRRSGEDDGKFEETR